MDIAKATTYLRKKDRKLKPVIEREGLIELSPARSYFHALLRSVVSQQLSVKAAAVIYGRVTLLLDNDIRPGRVLSAEPEALREAGLSYSKIKYLRALAEAFAERPAVYEELHLLENEAIILELTRIKGIGRWTAEMFLMFTLLREDVFPIDDLGIRKSMQNLFFEGRDTDRQTLIDRAEVWRPYRSVACFYLWKNLDNTP